MGEKYQLQNGRCCLENSNNGDIFYIYVASFILRSPKELYKLNKLIRETTPQDYFVLHRDTSCAGAEYDSSSTELCSGVQQFRTKYYRSPWNGSKS